MPLDVRDTTRRVPPYGIIRAARGGSMTPNVILFCRSLFRRRYRRGYTEGGDSYPLSLYIYIYIYIYIPGIYLYQPGCRVLHVIIWKPILRLPCASGLFFLLL